MSRKLAHSDGPFASIIGFSLTDVIRTCMLLTRIDDRKEIAKVRGEYFKDIRPVDTVMQVRRIINREWLVEIEVDAVVDGA
ncbi:MAG: Rid family hydrolase [candidate division Zixibacteria bacterium]|nr:Rid family hydrolase [candidate division Zixibacteria bacterium]MDH3937475.1 Rid family hydrolase [candidate division Zixibacteria bacterium]MDH4034823.1 Rid family hydrolase [candidate division Zixibacteria bacterium]